MSEKTCNLHPYSGGVATITELQTEITRAKAAEQAEITRAKTAEQKNADAISALSAKQPDFKAFQQKSVADLLNVVSTFGVVRVGYIDWSSPIAPDANTTIIFLLKGACLAISVSGKMYYASSSTNAWSKVPG